MNLKNTTIDMIKIFVWGLGCSACLQGMLNNAAKYGRDVALNAVEEIVKNAEEATEN